METVVPICFWDPFCSSFGPRDNNGGSPNVDIQTDSLPTTRLKKSKRESEKRNRSSE